MLFIFMSELTSIPRKSEQTLLIGNARARVTPSPALRYSVSTAGAIFCYEVTSIPIILSMEIPGINSITVDI